MTKPTILLVIPNLGSGGAQRVFHQHRNFFSQDFNVISCVFNFDGAFPEDRERAMISLDVPGGKNLIGKARNFFLRVQRLEKIKKDHNVALTISHLEGADYVNILSKGTGKAILWIHGTKLHDKEIKGNIGWLRKKILMPWLYRRADKVVCVSYGIADELKQIIPSSAPKIATVQNGINIDVVRAKSFEPLPPHWTSLLAKYFVIVAHCRFAPQKNLEAFIQIAAALKESDKIRFVLIGDGLQRDSLIRTCRESGLSIFNPWANDQWSEEKQLFFAGHQMNPFPWLRHSSLYMLTSSWEGFPLSICEAIVCGLPVIAADCPTGPKEILENTHSGMLMPRDSSVESWANSLRNLTADSKALERYRKNAAENANLLSENKARTETVNVVKQVLS